MINYVEWMTLQVITEAREYQLLNDVTSKSVTVNTKKQKKKHFGLLLKFSLEKKI
jgi:hypothetical protein